MNLEKLLAENMIRFGVKNLNEQLHKTLLNEGIAPGEGVVGAVKLQTKAGGNFTAELQDKLQAYPAGILEHGAMLATAVGTYNLIQKDRKLSKSMSSNTISALFGAFGYNQGVTNPELVKPLIATSANVTYEKTEVSVYPNPKYPNQIATMGKIDDITTGVRDTTKQLGTIYGKTINYLNAFNCENVESGDFTQYRLSDMVDQNNFVNFVKGAPAVNTVIVYTNGTKMPDKADKEIGTTNVGASAPIDKVYDVNFAQDVSTVPANDTEVARAIADAIAMFPDGNISNLSVVSSASPEYGKINNVTGWEKSYPKGVTGTGNPGTGPDDASRNIKLAYDRGVNFVAAINAGLVAQGKSEMVNTSINWQISDKGGSPNSLGRFSNVNWSKAGTPGKDVTKLASTGTEGDKISGKDTFTIMQHVFTCVS